MNNSEQLAMSTLDGFALSPQQAHAWASWHQDGAGPGCHAIGATLQGVRPEQVAQRLRLLIEEQEILRTRFVLHAQLREPVQVPEPFDAALLQLRRSDAAGLEPDALARCKQDLWQQVCATPVERGILAACATLDGGALYLVLAVAPLAADGRTLARLLQCAEGTLEARPEQPLQYPDVAAWLQEFAHAEEGETGRQYWRRQAPAAPGLIGFDSGAAAGPLLQRATRALPSALVDGLAERARRDGVRQDDLVFAGWLWMLRALCAGDSLPPLARAVDGVTAPELETAFGPLERLLPLTLPPGCAPLAPAGLADVAAASEALRHYQECYRAAPGAASAYGFRWLDWRMLAARVEALAAPAGQVRALGGVLLQQDGAALTLDYCAGLMTAQAADCLLEQWQCLLENMADGADQPGLRIGAALQQRILALGSGAARPAAPEQTVLCAMERQLAGGGGGRVIDGAAVGLGALNARANRLARQLRAGGIGKGDLVGLHLARSHDYVVAMLAVLKCGAAYLPMDVAYPRERLQYMAGQAQPALIVGADGGDGSFGALPWASLAALEAAAGALADTDLGIALAAQDAAYVLYTSGSTGQPKGVVIGHGALFNHMRWMLDACAFGAGDVFLQRTSSSFDASVWEFWAPLMLGATMVIARQDKTYDLAHLIGLVEREQVSVAQFVPSLLDTLLEYPAFTGSACLRHVLVGGEALGAGLKHKLFARMAVRLTNLYGPTEACIDATFAHCGPHDGAAISIGSPIDNTRVCVLDAAGRLAGIGIAGELCIAGAGLFQGYLKRADLTAEKVFVPAFSDEKHYRTGDLVRLQLDGSLDYLGRIDQQIKLNGFRIELAEIDAVVAGGGATRAVTVVNGGALVCFAQGGAGPATLLAHCARLLPAYMVPARIVELADFPLLPNGKLDLAALRSLAGAGEAEAPVEAPRGATEQRLARIWAKVLRRAEVGVNQRFFAIGGDSIRSIQVVYEAGQEGLAFSVMDVFEFQTVRALAAHLDSGAGAAPAPAAQQANPAPAALLARHADAYPATEMQRYMLERYAADTAATGVFHAQQAFMLSGAALVPAALAAALASAADAPNFRTRFVQDGDQCYQVLGPAGAPRVVQLDLSGLDAEAQRATLRARMQADRADRYDPFDLERPLLRIWLYVLAPDRVEVVLSNHHAVQDGWGNVEFMNRVTRHYQDLLQGRASPARAADGVGKEFALLQHALLEDPAQIAFWRAQTRAFAAPPAALAAADGRAYRAASFELAAPLAGALNRVGRAHNLSAKAMFLSAYLGALRKLELASVVAVVSNGRNEQLSDPFHAMGLFWNLMPFGAVLPDGDALARCAVVQQRLVAQEPYARFPLRRIEALAGRTDLVSASFNFVNFHNQQEGEGSANFEGTHVLDNFGLPVSLTVGVNGAERIALLLQFDAGIEALVAGLRPLLLDQLAELAGAH